MDTGELTTAGILVLRTVRADARRAIKMLEAARVSPAAIEDLRRSYAACERELELLIVDSHHLGDPVAQ